MINLKNENLSCCKTNIWTNKGLRTGNNLEFCGENFNSFCGNEGIQRHKTLRHTLQKYGVAQKLNRTIMEMVRCQLSDALLPEKY